MKTERLLFSLLIGLFTLTMGLYLTIKKPQCIDSRIVDKIDNVENEKKMESIYRCAYYKRIPYSRYFEQNTEALTERIQNIGIFLQNLESFQAPISIKITQQQPLHFKINKHQIEIGPQLLKSQAHFERAIIKIWLSERIKPEMISQALFSEVAADFLFYVYQGRLEIEDPIVGSKTQVGLYRWPEILKSKESYCESAWKISEHFEECGQINDNGQLTYANIITLSLRPLMTSVWIQSYQGLNYKQKRKFIQLLPKYLKTQQLSSEKIIEMLLSENQPLKFGMLNIKKMSDLMNSSILVQNESEYRQFYSNVTFHLQKAGVSDSFAEVYFDYLFEYPDDISTKSVLFNHLNKIATKNPQIQLAIKDKAKIWILPGSLSLPLSSFQQIKAQQQIYFACLGLKEIPMGKFINQAEKLLLIRGCDQSKKIDFESLVLKGLPLFSSKNKQLAFIQFHLPSFEMKAKELAHIKNFFDLVNVRDVSKPEFQILGWRQVQWYEDSQAYKPQAVVDAIEMFRTETN